MSDEEKVGPEDFSKAVFELLRETADERMAIARMRAENTVDWAKLGFDDRLGAQDQISQLYLKAGQKPPKHFAWAPSPAAMYTAVDMLKQVQAGQRHKFIQAIVPLEDPLASAKHTLLEAIINKDLTVTMGASMAQFFTGRYRTWQHPPYRKIICLDDLSWHLRATADGAPFNPTRKVAPATFDENIIFAARHSECIGPLSRTALCFLPYMHICWFCLPPEVIEIYDNGHLQYIRFSDGYEVRLRDPELLKLTTGVDGDRTDVLEGEVIDAEYRDVNETPRLTDGSKE